MRDQDEQLVESARTGDREAFGKLVVKHQNTVYATAYHLVGRFDAAEDLAQESFLEAYRCLSGLRDPAKFAAWLRGLTRRVCLNWLSRRKPAGVSLDDVTSTGANPGAQTTSADVATGRDETVEVVQNAIRSLPGKYREAIVMKHMTGLSYEQMSGTLGISASAVAVRLHRARQMLKPKLESLR